MSKIARCNSNDNAIKSLFLELFLSYELVTLLYLILLRFAMSIKAQFEQSIKNTSNVHLHTDQSAQLAAKNRVSTVTDVVMMLPWHNIR